MTVPADIELIEHIDRKFKESRDERAVGMREVHTKIDSLRDENRRQHESVVGRMTIAESKIDNHLDGHKKSDTKTDGWVRLGAAGAIGGFSTWLAKYFGAWGPQP